MTAIALGLLLTVGHAANPSSKNASVEEIAQQMASANRKRSEQLAGYTARRRYSVSYRGFPSSLSAEMVVDVTYVAPSTKSFRVVSHTGSKLLFDEVLSKLLKSEEEAAGKPAQTALSPDNYTFTLLGEETLTGRRCYVVHAEPRSESKFLYRGKVWIDAEDHAVSQIEAEPAKNPSFWIKDTRVHHVYTRTGEFWLPASNRSETTLRFGGTALLTIDYGTYKLQVVVPQQGSLETSQKEIY